MPTFSAARGGFGPAQILALSPAAWHRWNVGVTVTGAGVSQWDDATGLTHHLLQGTDANRPAKNADGSVLFDGTAHFLKSGTYTLNQPETIYMLVKQVSWTLNDSLCDGFAANTTMRLFQTGVTPQFQMQAGSAVATNGDLAVGAYGVVSAVFNGASSSNQVNANAQVTGNAGASNAGGLCIGAQSNGLGTFANIEVREIIVFPAAHDNATRAKVVAYLGRLGGVSI